EQCLDAPRPAVSAQRQRMRRVALLREPRQKKRFPEPCIAVTTVPEEERRLAAVAARSRGEMAADLEIGFDWEHLAIGVAREAMVMRRQCYLRRGNGGPRDRARMRAHP